MLDYGNQKIKDSSLYVNNLSKTFGGTKALNSVELLLMPGEIHGLLGQNGCGKSTLIKVLAGYHQPDSGGELWVNGESVPLPINPGEFSKYGMGFVHQDLGLVMDLTVLENFMLGKLSTNSSWRINWVDERKNAKATLERYGIDIDLDMQLINIGPVERAMLAIVRAVEDINTRSGGGPTKGLLVLDEPTVFLPRTEVDVLFDLVRKIVKQGFSVLFVSHDIDEVKELTNTFTVLRDGQMIIRGVTSEYSKEQIVEKIIGKEVELYAKKESAEGCYDGKPQVVVNNISGKLLKRLSFDIYKGQVLGVTGLEGSGFEELPYVFFGATEERSGTLKLGEEEFDLEKITPEIAVKSKMALIPADRQNKGSVGELLVKENMLMQVMESFNKIKLNLRKMDRVSYDTMGKFKVHPNDPNLNFSQLSGGNQQKVLMAKWMLGKSKLLILHEPTQGVDVGARQEIYKHIEAAANEGASVLCCSSDYEQLVQICDRVIVLVRGEICAELRGCDLNGPYLAQLCYDNSLL